MLCKKIKRRGGAEQYHADKKCEEAIAVAAEACAEDTAGQTCYICTQAVHWKTKEGLVRMCACRGTAGFAHVSCLAEQAKILVAECEENNLSDKAFDERWDRWDTCSLCEQQYHGVVSCALGWACWKTYVGRPERDGARVNAMRLLGNGLCLAEHYDDALSVQEAQLSMMRRLGTDEQSILVTQSNIANTYDALGRFEEALSMRQDTYSGWLKLKGDAHEETLREATSCAITLSNLQRYAEAKALLLKTIPVALRVLGDGHDHTLRMRTVYATALYQDPGATLDDIREAVTTLEEIERTARRVLGGTHPTTESIELTLRNARAVLRAHNTPQEGA